MMRRFSLRTLFMAVTLLAVTMALYAWFYSPARRTKVLLAELADRPGGHIDIGWIGRPSSEVIADLDAIGPAAVPYLIEELDNSDSTIRYLAARSRSLGESESIPVIPRRYHSPCHQEFA